MARETGDTGCKFLGVSMKWVALILLVLQTVAAVIVVRYSRLTTDANGDRYLNTTAVAMAEVVKLLAGAFIVWSENGYSLAKTGRTLSASTLQSPVPMLQVAVPAILYTFQNNLIFVALSNLSGAVYQVAYQLKILTTALLSVILLRKQLTATKWLALFTLTGGVALIQFPTDGATPAELPGKGNQVVGLVAVLSACFTSACAGVYFEKVLKQTPISIWVRNIQLALYGTVLAIIGAFWTDGEIIRTKGFFQGYNAVVWSAVLLQALGGLIVAAVLKYADNILKCFGNALSIVLSCILSWWLLNDFQPSALFGVGVAAVLLATFLYSSDVPLSALWGARTGGADAKAGVEFRVVASTDEDYDATSPRQASPTAHE
ncbi:udp-galactose transporter subfamily protein [Cystoisospora suis]|uniref:Udp-galactose transporter subfamily protein n=1 Tax=Cystoisospora suis TaxID=483139 RepID=A0A2C6LFZ1_9APIC|nr:udp-galactose transporter subfamily protein [Cystoisospora suis]